MGNIVSNTVNDTLTADIMPVNYMHVIIGTSVFTLIGIIFELFIIKMVQNDERKKKQPEISFVSKVGLFFLSVLIFSIIGYSIIYNILFCFTNPKICAVSTGRQMLRRNRRRY